MGRDRLIESKEWLTFFKDSLSFISSHASLSASTDNLSSLNFWEYVRYENEVLDQEYISLRENNLK